MYIHTYIYFCWRPHFTAMLYISLLQKSTICPQSIHLYNLYNIDSIRYYGQSQLQLIFEERERERDE